MRGAVLLSLFGLVAGAVPAAAGPVAAGPVAVAFDHPETYTDATLYGGHGLKAEQPALDAIAQYLERLGARYLAPDQTLSIEVLNVDLAGQYEPWRALSYDVRILRDIYPPRITLRYRLSEAGRTLVEGREVVSDINYLANGVARQDQDPLRYEKAMLSNWFQARLVARKAAPGGA
ncbi:MAG: DUF3016 domain-containing protein [Acetobacteraceae bacterium]